MRATPEELGPRDAPAGTGGTNMSKKLWSLLLGMILVGSVFLAPAAQAAEAPFVTVVTEADIAWVEVLASEVVSGLKIKIMAPGARSSSRTLWQTCRFADSQPGLYRCGIDASEGSLAQKREGTWAAKVISGGAQVASARFTL